MISNLNKLGNFKKCIIEKLPQIALLASMGLRKGITISTMSKQPFGGPVVIRVGKRNIALAHEIAEQIEVKKIS